MNNTQTHTAALAFSALMLAALPAYSLGTFQGYVGASVRSHPQNAADPQQGSEVVSAVVVPEWYHQWNNRDDSINIKLFSRYDSEDSERSHNDIRELYWQHVGSDWEFTLGINKVYWGVTESQHLVDIVNQTDQVEAFDGEEKLGQAMAHLALIKNWGVIDLLLLPGFRPRTFAGSDGRLRSIPVTHAAQDSYSASQGKDHIDGAVRWSHYIGDMNLALSWFRGTSRDPVFLANGNSLQPHYLQINQYGLEAQYISGDWLWKLEAINRDYLHSLSNTEDYTATTAGFEYTWVGFADNSWDLGLLLEHSYDSRAQGFSPLQNDLMAGGRWSFNDAASSALLFGTIVDLDDSNSQSAFLEASTRLGDATRLLVEAFYFDSSSRQDPLYSVKQDSYIELALEYYF